jgi:hypothetical protein
MGGCGDYEIAGGWDGRGGQGRQPVTMETVIKGDTSELYDAN